MSTPTSPNTRQFTDSIPANVTNTLDRQIYSSSNYVRAEIKSIAGTLDHVRRHSDENHRDPEVTANLELAYRHLEDASMRLGKVLQAIDGGVSVYDPKTTVGAPNRVAGHLSGCRTEIGQSCSCGGDRIKNTTERTPVVNRSPDGSEIHADGHSELPPVASALESQRENHGAGENGGLMRMGEVG